MLTESLRERADRLSRSSLLLFRSGAFLYPATTHSNIDDHSHEPDPDKRVTSPMQEFGGREVGIGATVTLVGLLLAYAVPFLVTF